MLHLNHLPATRLLSEAPLGPQRESPAPSLSLPHTLPARTPALHRCPLTHPCRNASNTTSARIQGLEKPVPQCVWAQSLLPTFSRAGPSTWPRAKLWPEQMDRLQFKPPLLCLAPDRRGWEHRAWLCPSEAPERVTGTSRHGAQAGGTGCCSESARGRRNKHLCTGLGSGPRGLSGWPAEQLWARPGFSGFGRPRLRLTGLPTTESPTQGLLTTHMCL